MDEHLNKQKERFNSMNWAVKRINVLNRLSLGGKEFKNKNETLFNDRGERTKLEITDVKLRSALQNLLSKALDDKFIDDFSGEAKNLAI